MLEQLVRRIIKTGQVHKWLKYLCVLALALVFGSAALMEGAAKVYGWVKDSVRSFAAVGLELRNNYWEQRERRQSTPPLRPFVSARRPAARMTALVLSVCMVFTLMPTTAFAEEFDSGPVLGVSGVCTHHTHDDACGYVAPETEQPCDHTHKQECYTDELICDLAEITPETATNSDAPHTHTKVCYGLDCHHERGEHDDTCGYTKEIQGKACTYLCELCKAKDSGVDKPAACICTERCTPADVEIGIEASISPDCPLCAAENADLSACAGNPTYEAVEKVVAMIDALPSMDEWMAMDDDAARTVIDNILAAKEAYDALTEVERAMIDEARTKKLTALSELAQQLAAVMPMTLSYSVDWAGSGTEKAPWQITSVEELQGINHYDFSKVSESKYFRLMNDLDLSDLEWVPLSPKFPQFKFLFFDGNNHVISNLTVTENSAPIIDSWCYGGLFGNLGYGSISNLGIKNANVSLAGSTAGSKYAGGLIGSGSSVTITNCYVVESEVEGTVAGGLAGYGSSILNSFVADTTVTRMPHENNNYGMAGGLAGSGGTIELINSYFAGTLVLNGGASEVLAGNPSRPTRTNCFVLDTSADAAGVTVASAGVIKKTEAEFQSGEVAYTLNTGTNSPKFRQNLKADVDGYPVDDLPVLNPEHRTVYKEDSSYHNGYSITWPAVSSSMCTLTPLQNSINPAPPKGSFQFSLSNWNSGIDQSKVVVKANDVVLTKGNMDLYTISNITADQVITIETADKLEFTVTLPDMTGICTIKPVDGYSSPVYAGDSFNFTVSEWTAPYNPHPNNFSVDVNGSRINQNTYDENGVSTFSVTNIQENINITIRPDKWEFKIRYTNGMDVSLEDENGKDKVWLQSGERVWYGNGLGEDPSEQGYIVPYGEDITLKTKVNEAYGWDNDNITIVYDGNTISHDVGKPGEYTFRNITENHTISDINVPKVQHPITYRATDSFTVSKATSETDDNADRYSDFGIVVEPPVDDPDATYIIKLADPSALPPISAGGGISIDPNWDVSGYEVYMNENITYTTNTLKNNGNNSYTVQCVDRPLAVVVVKASPTITYTLTNISAHGEPETINYSEALDITLSAKSGYELPNTITVIMAGKMLTAANEYTYDKATGKVGISSVLGDVVITAVGEYKNLPQAAKPNASFRATGTDSGTLTDVTADMLYSVNGGGSWYPITSTSANIASGITTTNGVQVKRQGDGATTVDSDVQSIAVTQAAVPTGVGKTDETSVTNDGTITGVTTVMEYKPSTTSTYTSITGTTVTGLAPGTYMVRVKASGTVLASGDATVTIAAYTPAPTYSIGLDKTGTHTFTGVAVGYTEQTPLTVTVSNTGNQSTGVLVIALSGTNSGSFTLSKTSISSLAVSGTDTFTVKPNTGLAVGTYTATVTVSGGNSISGSFGVSFTVSQTAPDPDIATVAAAKSAAEGATYTATTQAATDTEAKTNTYVKNIATTAVNNSGVTVAITKVSYTAPTAGTAANPSGTNGSYKFKITVSKGTQSDTTTEKTLTITATPYTSPTHKPVSSITGIPTTATAGVALALTGTVNPADATNKTIVWSAKNAGNTGATITGNTLNTTAAGTVVVTATIDNGLTATTDYTQDTSITVSNVPVTDAEKIVAVKAAIESVLNNMVVSNATTAQDILNVVGGAASNGVTVAWDSANGFSKTAATTDSAGSITGALKLTLNSESATVVVNKTIPKLTGVTYTITLNANGGSVSPASLSVAAGGMVALPTPTRGGRYRFDGWFTATSGGTQYTDSTIINGNVTLYARWTYTGGGSDKAVTPPTPDKPNVPTESEIKVSGKVDTNGNATATITDKAVSDAIRQAEDAANKNGNLQNGITLVLNVDTGGNTATSVSVNLPKVTQETIISKKIVNTVIVVNNPDIQIGIDLAAVGAINTQARADVSISATRMDNEKLTGAAKEAIGSRPAFDLRATYQNGAKSVTNFGGGSVSVAFPYTLQAGEIPGSLYAVYVDANGQVSYLTGSSYDAQSKALRFTTNHFSVYGIGCKAPAGFTDSGNHWAGADIEFVANRGLMNGTAGTTFSPDGAMTRSMLVEALGRMAGVDSTKYQNILFTDVAADAHYAPYAAWAAEKGITVGTTATTFSPNKAVTRQELAVYMARYAEATGYQAPQVREAITFTDNSAIESWAAAAVKQMQMAGIVNCKNGNRFDPTGTATRGEAAALLHRYVELVINPATAQGLDINDSGSVMLYENGRLVKSQSREVDHNTYQFNIYGEAALPPADNKKTGTHIVVKGESFYSIARKYGVSPKALMEINGRREDDEIYPGDVLKVPQA